MITLNSGVSSLANVSQEPLKKHDRFPCLDGMRALAAFLVVTYHVCSKYLFFPGGSKSWSFVYLFGNLGVAIFFLLSGFLLYRPYVLSALSGTQSQSTIQFWKRRFFRIFPAYWLALVVVAFVLHRISLEGPKDFFTLFSLLHTYQISSVQKGLGVDWTLGIEVSFYIAVPFIALMLKWLTRRAQAVRSRVLVHLAGAGFLFILAQVFRFWMTSRGSSGAAGPRVSFPFSQFNLEIFNFFDWFAFGILLAAASAWVTMGGRLPWFVRALVNYPWVSWLLAVEIFWVIQQLHLPYIAFVPLTRVQIFGTTSGYGLIALFLLAPMCLGDQSKGSIRRILASRPIAWLGIISYGIYLWHLIWLDQIILWARQGSVPINLWTWFAMTIAGAVTFATISYYLLERPMVVLSQRRRNRDISEINEV